MGDLLIPKHKGRRFLMIPGTDRQHPTRIIPLVGTDRSEQDWLVRGMLEKGGVKDAEAEIEKAEAFREDLVKQQLVNIELNRRLEGQLPRMSKRNGQWVFRR